MSSFFSCAAYDDLETTIRLDDHVVFLALEDKEKNTSVHLTLNPFQVRVLAKYLSIALSQMKFSGLTEENHFGNLTVQIEKENLPEESFDDEEYALAVPF
ncbi:MAG: hypothetical protein IJG80_03240 [Selenomonadaceae bacterium]|nr:hypothetical protein [Selenomonadaceae bacterium]MBQ9497891.1 hypothetical protein [Selenomonadaceae bacterium]